MATDPSPHLLADLSRSSGGAFAALLWEWLITLGDEVDSVWARRNSSWLKWIYIFSRYFPLVVHTVSRAVEFGIKFDFLHNNAMMRAWYASQVISASLLVSAMEVILMARVYALHSQPRWLRQLLIALLILENIVSVVGLALTFPDKSFDPQSLVTHLPKSFAYFGVAALVVQIILLTFTVRKYIQLPCKRVPLVKLMIRDGTLAFAVFAVFISVIVIYTLCDLAYAVAGYAWLLSAISCMTCRLVINLQRVPRQPTRSGPLTSTNIQFTTVITDHNIDDIFTFSHRTRTSTLYTASTLPTRTPSPRNISS